MKSDFIQPTFDGARFTENTLPLDVAKDLAAYENLVIELAKRLYLADNPDRQRVPKGFGADFHLHLDRIESGSAKPVLAVVTAATLALGSGFNNYFEQARELITECVAAPDQQLPPRFPPELLIHFNQVGRSLQPGERMELTSEKGVTASLTPERRKHLVLAADQVYEQEIVLSGTIEEADWEKSTFRLRQTDGSRTVVPMIDSFHSEARKYGGRHRHQVTINGVGAFDSWDQLQKVVSMESFEVQPNYQLASKFDELRALEDGWHDGQGISPDKTKLDQLATRIVGNYPEKIPLPLVVPTPEGNLLFEWSAPGDPSVDIRLSDMTAECHAFSSDMTDIERTFDLSTDQEWPKFYEFLNHLIGQVSA